jgi:hypothetical protein
MPTVLRHGGFRFYMWPNDHHPPHVHAEYAGEVAVIDIDTLAVRPRPTMRTADIARAAALVLENRDLLLAHWRKLHA